MSVDGDSDHQTEGEDRVDQRLAELGRGGDLMVEVQRLRIVGQRGDQQVVGLGDRAGDGMSDRVADLPLVEIASGMGAAVGAARPCHSSGARRVSRALRSAIRCARSPHSGRSARMTLSDMAEHLSDLVQRLQGDRMAVTAIRSAQLFAGDVSMRRAFELLANRAAADPRLFNR